MRQYLTAKIQAISKSEIEGIIDPLRLEKLKETDPNPDIRVYSIGHEGAANLHLPGIGKKTLTWIQAAVQWVADKLQLGTAVFNKHDPNTNSHVGREQIGEVVGKAVRHIGDRLNTLAAIYIKPQFRSRPLDIASIEADIEYAQDGSQAWPTAINDVSGIALGTSGIDIPGFPGATLLGAVQAFVQASGRDIGAKTMNLSEVKQAVADLGLTPTQVFSLEDIMEDSSVAGKVKEAKNTLQKAADRWKSEVDASREKLAALENAKADSDKKLKQTEMRSKSSAIIDAILADRDMLDSKAKLFIKRGLKNFTTEATDEDALKADLSKFVDTTAKEFQELSKEIFGAEDTKPASNEALHIPDEFLVSNQKSASTESQQQQVKSPVTRDDVLKAEMNPDVNVLIPGGKAAKEALKT